VKLASRPGSSSSLELGRNFARGNCVLQVSDVASPEECAELLKYGLRAAEKQQASTWARTASFLAEFTSNNPRSEGRVRVPIRSLHPRQAQQFDNLMARVCSFVDNELPSVAKLFERDVDMDGDVTSNTCMLCDEPSTVSLSALHASGGLTYSTREPAINVYRPKGEFLAHTDRQTLTVLIPLSSPESYEGGGTGFWSSASDKGLPQYGQPASAPLSAPGVVLRPPQRAPRSCTVAASHTRACRWRRDAASSSWPALVRVGSTSKCSTLCENSQVGDCCDWCRLDRAHPDDRPTTHLSHSLIPCSHCDRSLGLH